MRPLGDQHVEGRDRRSVTSFPSGARVPNARAASVIIGPSLDRERAAELFRQIVAPHLGDAFTLARWLAGNASDAEDIVQDAAIRALKAIATWRGGSPRAWLLAIVRNTAFTALAKKRSSALVMVGDLADIDDATTQTIDTTPQPTPETELIRRADTAAVRRAIAGLPLPMREVVVLRDVNGMSYKEIAEVLSLPVGTVMSRLARGRQQLAVLLSETNR
jgi:RNA polymerase sigma-70 factor (ECF subfamily)